MKQNNIEKICIIIAVIAEILFFVLLFFMVFSSCKSPQKTVSGSKLNQTTNISNDVSSSDEKQFKERIDQIIKRLIIDELNIEVKNVKYDTEKPVDSTTGKHPVSEEMNVKVNRQTNVNETDSIRKSTDSISALKTNDNSNTTVKTKSETKETKQTGLSALQKNLIAAGIISIIGFIIFIIIKIKK